jgi:hypothetical protein
MVRPWSDVHGQIEDLFRDPGSVAARVGVARICDANHPAWTGTEVPAYLAYAKQYMPAGTPFGLYGGVTTAESEGTPEDARNTFKLMEGSWNIVAETHCNELSFINDCSGKDTNGFQCRCETNCHAVTVWCGADELPRILFVSTKPVERDAELVLDYGDNYWPGFDREAAATARSEAEEDHTVAANAHKAREAVHVEAGETASAEDGNGESFGLSPDADVPTYVRIHVRTKGVRTKGVRTKGASRSAFVGDDLRQPQQRDWFDSLTGLTGLQELACASSIVHVQSTNPSRTGLFGSATTQGALVAAGAQTAADRGKAARVGAIELAAEEAGAAQRAPQRARLDAGAAAAGARMGVVALDGEAPQAPKLVWPGKQAAAAVALRPPGYDICESRFSTFTTSSWAAPGGAVRLRNQKKRKMCESCGLKRTDHGLASEAKKRLCADCGNAEGSVSF